MVVYTVLGFRDSVKTIQSLLAIPDGHRHKSLCPHNSTGYNGYFAYTVPDENSLLYRGLHKVLRIQNKLAITDDRVLNKSILPTHILIVPFSQEICVTVEIPGFSPQVKPFEL